jgi:hypothetical protein
MMCFSAGCGRTEYLSNHGGARTSGIVAWMGLETGPS